MYKTVRQGENSLQYTILPQTEEVFTNSGVRGKGRDYSPSSHARRINRKVVFYYMAVIVFGLILAVGTLLFALVLSGIVPMDLPSHIGIIKLSQKGMGNQLTSTVQPDKKKDLIDKLSILPLNKTEESATTKTILTTTEQTTTTTEWMLPARKRLQQSTPGTPQITTPQPDPILSTKPTEKSSPPYVRKSNVDQMIDHDQNWTDFDDDDDGEDYDAVRASTVEIPSAKKSTNNLAVLALTTDEPKISTTVVYASVDNSNKTKSRVDKLSDVKEMILGDDDEEYKEPLTDEDDVSEQMDVKMAQAKSSWLQARWPFVDASSYFQWTGYSARDNLLLPAILSAALSALLVLAILCYALRRRQRCKRRIQEIGNLTSDLQAEDNTILLAAENPSEED